MQPVTEQELKRIIREAKEAGKDTSEIERLLASRAFDNPASGEVKVIEEGKKKKVIISTGPAREEDFE